MVAAEGLGAAAAGFGDAWIDDRAHGCLLRVDACRGTVTARIRVDGRLAIGAGARAAWALQSGGGYGLGLRGPLLKVDPADQPHQRAHRVAHAEWIPRPGASLPARSWGRFGTTGLIAANRMLWVPAADGRVVVARPALAL